MTTILTLKRSGLGFVPADRVTREALADIADGATMFAQRRNPRNMAQHRAYFAMLQNVCDATGKWPSVESLSYDLSVKLKRGTIETSPRSGKARWIPDSRAVSAMSREDFERLHHDTVAVLCEWLQCHPDDLNDKMQ